MKESINITITIKDPNDSIPPWHVIAVVPNEEWQAMSHDDRRLKLEGILLKHIDWDYKVGDVFTPAQPPPVIPQPPRDESMNLPKKYQSENLKLGAKQELFMRLLPRLIDKAHSLGFEIRGGDLFRDSRVHGSLGEKRGYGSKNSCHKLKLAIDLNLMKDGKLVTTTMGHAKLGAWWEKQHALCSWGGKFDDGNHYSLKHQGYM